MSEHAREYYIRKREVGDGWVELTIHMLRPTRTPDYEARGPIASRRIMQFVLSVGSAIAHMSGDDETHACIEGLGTRLGLK